MEIVEGDCGINSHEEKLLGDPIFIKKNGEKDELFKLMKKSKIKIYGKFSFNTLY